MIVNITQAKNIIVLFLVLVLLGCSGGSDEEEAPVKRNPEATNLISPLKDAECNQGNIISETESNVTFEWNSAAHTDEYTLVIKNLKDGSEHTVNTTETKKTERLLRGTPYSWYIVSKSKAVSETAKSDLWKFYNAGLGIEQYAPFPAELISPEMGGLIGSIVSFSWNGNDIDNDIVSYDFYLSTANPPTTLHTTTETTSIIDVTLNSDTNYYWKVVSKDAAGNNSESQIFEFKTGS
ncbi:hypothetical protein KFZ70_14225 [Tamlana fucoidanivorans]|uniref:Fibronectin type-III domain-containing protein n=1 Tax=Allotamlana fucoidanivorans TaxID=2583814 RepID=A0A5C4SQV5_9FLAO|nr:hypothetical protein [Tamlana fucoidanivorans]TNJ46584.1 hypothetical protein FGF67_02835 [Tamlana fucoidanivorans]